MINLSKLFRTLFLVLMMASTFAVTAQQVDIGLFQAGPDVLEVRLRPAGNFNGIVSNVAFTLRWPDNTNSNLGAIDQPSKESAYIPMVKSGNVHSEDGHNYQVFAGFGMKAMTDLNANWNLGDEIVLMTIPVNGNIEDFQLVNDHWTNEIKNNGSFYTSLGGKNQTGLIYKSEVVTTGIDDLDPFTVKIFPNPTTGNFQIEANFAKPGNYKIELINTLGERVYVEEIKDHQGAYHKTIDLSKFSIGVYMLRVHGEEQSFEDEIVKL